MFKDKSTIELERRLADKKAKAKAWSERVIREEKQGLSIEARSEAINTANKFLADVANIEKALNSGDTFIDQSIEYSGYFANQPVEPIAKKRFRVNTNRDHYIVSKYNIVSSADEVNENEFGGPLSINELVHTIKTESDDRVIIDDYLTVSEFIYEDDKENVNIAIDDLHKTRLVNAENKNVLKLLTGSKASTVVTVGEIIATINAKLCAKSKRNAIIFTNKDGFAKMDIMSNGISLIKRINGKFVFSDKYIIREFDNEIFPNNEDGTAPVLIGDFDNIVKIGISTMQDFEKNDIGTYRKSDRRRMKLIPTLASTDDEAYIFCSLL